VLDYIRETLENVPAALARLALLSVMLFLFWHIQNRLTKFDDGEELYVKNNWAYFWHRASLVIAFIIAAWPAFTRSTEEPWYSLIGQTMEYLWVFAALLAVRIIVDKVVLPRQNNLQELLNGNLALGIVEAGFYIGVGFVLNGSLSGNSPSVWLGFASTVVFGLLGLAAMIGVFALHEAVTPWNLRENIRDGKMTAALEVAGLLAASGIGIRAAVAGDFNGWKEGFIAFFGTLIFVVAMLYLFRWVIDRAILTNCTVKTVQANNQVVASALLSVLFIGAGFMVAGIVSTQL
jgi:uncharacterized membrane protein YjfL (UPF0719 family)